MSHELEQHEDQVAFVDIRTDAWHALNNLPPDLLGTPLTAEVALREAHMTDWNVRKEAAYVVTDPEALKAAIKTHRAKGTAASAAKALSELLDHLRRIPDAYGTLRDSPWTPGEVDVFGAVGNQWAPFQNEELTDFLNALVDESHGLIETAGSLRGGREVFVTMKLPDTMTIGGVDNLDLYLAALTAHDGSKATRFLATPVRIVCANTQIWAIKAAVASVSVRHTSGASHYVEAARQNLGLAFKAFDEFGEEAERMIQTQSTEAEFMEIIGRVFGVPDEDSKRSQTMANQRNDTLLRLWNDADTNGAIRDTRWAGLQSVSEYLDHYAPVSGASGDPARAAMLRAERVVSGWSQVKIRKTAFQAFRVPEPKEELTV